MTNNASAPGPMIPGGVAPEKPGSTVFLWLAILATASGSLTFNILHYHGHLPDSYAAFFAGALPPVVSAVGGHSLKYFEKHWEQVVIFAAVVGAMAVSAKGTSAILMKADGEFFSWLFSIVLDTLDLMFLYALAKHHDLLRAYKAYAAEREAGRNLWTPVTPGQAAPARNQAPAAWSGNQDRPAAGSREEGSALVPGTAAPAPAVPAAGSGNRQELPAAGTGSGGGNQDLVPARREQPAPAAPRPARAAVPAPVPAPAPALPAAGEKESREDVIEDMKSRPRPLVDAAAAEQRALDLIAEFARRTGLRMNNQELGLALGMKKAAAGVLRKEIQDREGKEEAAA